MKSVHHLSLFPLALLFFSALPTCGLSQKTGRFLEGTAPDEEVPTVPRPPQDADQDRLRGPRVVLLALPGFSAGMAERGMREGWLPVLRRLRIDATWQRLSAGVDAAPMSALRAGSTLLLGAERDPGVPFYVADAAASVLFPDGAPPGYAATLPRLGFPLAGTIYDHAARAGKDALVLRWPVGLADAGRGGRDLRGGALPGVSFGDDGYTAVRETTGERARRVLPHGVVIDVPRSTGGAEFDLFRFEIAGPHDGPIGAPALVTLVEAFASPDRSSVRVASSAGEVEATAGEWSEPLALRFRSTAGQALFARSRVYLRPTGLPRMELLVEAPQFDPLRPPAWQPLSSPPELAAEVEERFRPQHSPTTTAGTPASAILDGIIDPRDAAATLEVDHHDRRRLFEEVIALGDADLVVQWLPLVEDTLKLVHATSDQDREVEMFGQRLPWTSIDLAGAAALDEVIGSVVMAASAARHEEEVTLVVVAPYGITAGRPDATEGWWAVTRLTASSTAAPRLADIAPTVAQLLGIAPLPGVQGIAWSYGPPMPRLPNAEYTHERFVEPEEEDGADPVGE